MTDEANEETLPADQDISEMFLLTHGCYLLAFWTINVIKTPEEHE